VCMLYFESVDWYWRIFGDDNAGERGVLCLSDAAFDASPSVKRVQRI